MKNYTVKTVEQEELEWITCDKCNEMFIDSNDAYSYAIDNFVTIKKTFSFYSVRDGETYETDLCESCAVEVLVNYWKKK